MRKTEDMYSIAIRRRENSNDYFWKHQDYSFIDCKIPGHNRFWFADPFLFEHNQTLYVFYEAYDLVERKGKIGYSIIKGDQATEPAIIIDEPYHLSFPNIFEYQGNIYIMPESSTDYRVKLFRAVNFPDEWEPADTVLPEAYAVDSIFLQDNNTTYLLANERYHHPPVGKLSSCWVKNMLYPLNSELKAISRGELVAEGEYGVRNAGASILTDNMLIRVGQNCNDGNYGQGLVFNQVESVSPYKEKELLYIDAKEMRQHITASVSETIVGTHTYNHSEHYEVIDLIFRRPISKWLKIKRFVALIKKKLRNRFF